MAAFRAVTLVPGMCGLALIAAIASAPAVSAGVVTPEVSGAAGSLDPSFAGGVGYRAIPNPSTVVDAARTKRAGKRVLVDGGGRLRTIVRYPVAGYGGASVLLMRGWTTNGWVDRSFYSGQAKSLPSGSDTDGSALKAASIASDSSISLGFQEWDGMSFLRLHSTGRQIARRYERWRDDGTSGGAVDFLPTGAPVVCWTMADGSSTRLTLFDTGLRQVGYRNGVPLPGSCYDLVVQGSHLWYMGTGRANADGYQTVGVARTDLALAPDPSWGQKGYAEVSLPFAPSNMNSYQSAVLGLAHGGAYVWRSARYEGVVSIAKLTPAGGLDAGYGAGGVVKLGGTSGLLRNRRVLVNAMVADTKGVVASIAVRDPAGTEPWRYRLIRLTPNGDLDPLFGEAGIVTISQQATSLALDSRGRILTLSSVSSGSVYLARRLS